MFKGTITKQKVKQKTQKKMKKISKNLVKINLSSVSKRYFVGLMIVGLMVGFVFSPFANADRYSSQIAQLEAENSHNHDEVNALEMRAENIEDAINKLQQRINQLQAQINANKKKSNRIKGEIKVAEAELQHQRDILGQNIKAMYLEGEISTLEMLASSKDLSEFVDKEQYRNTVKDKIKGQVDKITELRLKLKAQHEKIEALIKEDEDLRSKIAKQKAEQNRLLAMNKAEQAEFNRQIAKNNKKIDELRNAQAALARRLSGGVFVSLGPVRQGDVIGTVGNTGFSTGAHLHLEARGSNGGLLNPNNFLGSSWIRPVSGGYVSQDYGVYNSWYVSGRHPGIDYAGVTGSPVKAVASGQIISRGCSQDSSFFGGTPAYGYAVVIQHNDGNFSVYAHMNPPSSGYGHCSSSYGF